MVRSWYMDDWERGDCRFPRHFFPPQYITLDRLIKRTGVFHWQIDLSEGNEFAATERIEWITREHKFMTEDILEIKDTPNLPIQLQEWYKPHIHGVDEARLVLEGSAYYDVEDARQNKWIRIFIEKGDFVIIPAGCLHRFTTDTSNYVKCRRFFQTQDGDPIPISKLVCHLHHLRVEYLAKYGPTASEKEAMAKQNMETSQATATTA